MANDPAHGRVASHKTKCRNGKTALVPYAHGFTARHKIAAVIGAAHILTQLRTFRWRERPAADRTTRRGGRLAAHRLTPALAIGRRRRHNHNRFGFFLRNRRKTIRRPRLCARTAQTYGKCIQHPRLECGSKTQGKKNRVHGAKLSRIAAVPESNYSAENSAENSTGITVHLSIGKLVSKIKKKKKHL